MRWIISWSGPVASWSLSWLPGSLKKTVALFFGLFFAHFDFALEQVDGNGTIQFKLKCLRSLEVVFAV